MKKQLARLNIREITIRDTLRRTELYLMVRSHGKGIDDIYSVGKKRIPMEIPIYLVILLESWTILLWLKPEKITMKTVYLNGIKAEMESPISLFLRRS